MKPILGIETSCDETAAAIVEDGVKILSNIIASQIDIHRKYGGVVPEIAGRKHLEALLPVIEEAMREANLTFNALEAIAVTHKPGLIGALLVGLSAAKTLAYCHNLPLIGVNHILAHIYSNHLIHKDLTHPYLSLTVSGGHTLLVHSKSPLEFEILGSTLDDAAGEGFDKIAKLLNLGFPGGPAIQKYAEKGNPNAIKFPRPMLKKKNYNFSFSGLKTAVAVYVQKQKETGNKINLEDIAASFQEAVVDVLTIKTLKAAKDLNINIITLAGGVAANKPLRERLEEKGKKNQIKIYVPPLYLCSDNAAMIAGIAYHQILAGDFASLSLNAEASGGKKPRI